MQNLHEVTVYLPASCSRNCTACTSYCKQFNHCTICREGILNQTDYTRLLHQFHTCGIQRVNLSGGGDPLENSYVRQLLSDFAESGFKKHLYLDFSFLFFLFYTDMECLDSWNFPEEALIQVCPFYSGNNLSFFQDFVFTDLQDILAVPIDRKTIFRHKALNDKIGRAHV